MRRERIRGLRLGFSVTCSLALHVALAALVSLRACGGDRPSIATRSEVLDVQVNTVSPPPPSRTARPGGGVPTARADVRAQVSPRPVHRARVETPEPEPAPTPPSPPPPVEMPPDEAARLDAVAAPSHREEPPTAPSPAAGAYGTGPGLHGGPGGRGIGPGGAEVPTVAQGFAFGRASPGPFKGVACFIPPGVLRIADVHGCAPVAVFYTDSFNVPERYQGEGFPGISDRSTWFMIDYQGAFTVGQDGSYQFRLHSDDGSYLFIDGTMVIENDGKHKPESRSGHIALRAGSHQLRILYAQTTDRMALQLFVRTPGARERLFTPHL
jgi:hypothetical protein